MKKIIIITVSVFLFVGGLVVWALNEDSKVAEYKAEKNIENLAPIGQVFEEQKVSHIKPGEDHEAYNSNPPTSGAHWADQADWGVYDQPLIDEQAVHNLEHGGIWISYKDIDEETKTNLIKIAKANSQSVILSPREGNDTSIVLASWTRLEKMDSYDAAKIIDFISRNKNNSPEPIAR
ncbi:MAG: DUF3105 domain-containing protein [Candidatus Pacebacteria bacterium]|nr:DUF3105 domain-containing protein [Candidatus Paceibacterota bacterium]